MIDTLATPTVARTAEEISLRTQAAEAATPQIFLIVTDSENAPVLCSVPQMNALLLFAQSRFEQQDFDILARRAANRNDLLAAYDSLDQYAQDRVADNACITEKLRAEASPDLAYAWEVSDLVEIWASDFLRGDAGYAGTPAVFPSYTEQEMSRIAAVFAEVQAIDQSREARRDAEEAASRADDDLSRQIGEILAPLTPAERREALRQVRPHIEAIIAARGEEGEEGAGNG